MKAKFTARVEYSNGSISVPASFPSEVAVDTWANERLLDDPGAVVTVWKANSAKIHKVYRTKKYLSADEEQAHYEAEADSNMRYIRAKLPHATPRELALIASFIKGLGVPGWAERSE